MSSVSALAKLLLAALACASLTGCAPPPKVATYEPPDERFVLFASGASDVANTDGFFALGYVVAMLDEHPGYHALVVGHADTSGASDRNRELCFRRARSVRKILLGHGVAEARVTLAAPRAGDGATSAALSRRADVYLYDPSQDDVTKRLGYEVELRKD